MDPESICLVLTALAGAAATGVSSGITTVAGSAVSDAYQALRARLSRLWRVGSPGDQAIKEFEREGDADKSGLRDLLAAVDAQTAGELTILAERLIQVLPERTPVQFFSGNSGVMVNNQSPYSKQVNNFPAVSPRRLGTPGDVGV